MPIINKDNEPIKSIEGTINYYQEKKDIQLKCSKCQNNEMEIETKIIGLPKILIINFKRIGEQNFYNNEVEINMNLKMGELIENKNYDNYKYELIGFIIHLGNELSGHNIAICKNFFDDRWYQYNDSSVIYISNDKVPKLLYNGFLFFYKWEGIKITEEKKKNLADIACKIRNQTFS